MSAFTVDKAFQGAGAQAGLELWRVEAKQVVKQAECNGKFHVGDSYILLATLPKGNGLEWKIHFWLGSESSSDEMGIAAYKTVELDESLGGSPVQYREIQGYESSQFLSYFKEGGVEYLPGGVESGFIKVERDTYRTRLLHLKGKRVVRATEVPLAASSLNTGDVFILDAGLKLYLFNGAKANHAEKARGVEMIAKIKDDERGGRAQVVFVHEDPKNAAFWEALGGYQEITQEGEPDDVVERILAESLQLHKITAAATDDGDAYTTELVKVAALKKEVLNTKEAYILDAGRELYVWVGRGAAAAIKKQAVVVASDYLTANSKPLHTPVTKVVEGAETTAFKAFFTFWEPLKLPNFMNRGAVSTVAKSSQEAVDHSALSKRMLTGASKRAGYADADDVPVDDGSGHLTVWRIEDFKKVEVPRESYGQFYGGDSYVLLYTYKVRNREEYIIYMWQGRDSTADEKGSSALLAKDLDDSLNGSPVQVRVSQGKEPKHFRSLFKGGMVVHYGGHASGFRTANDSNSSEQDESESAAATTTACFHIKGTNETNTYGVEVDAVAASLNSGDTFVVVTPSTVFTWTGTHCSAEELTIALKISATLKEYRGVAGRTEVMVEEGKEPIEFWDALGGQGEYPECTADEEVAQEPRLFQISNATGKLNVEEIENFDQSDLCADDVMLLDTHTTVYIWIGSGSNETERKEAMTVAQTYIDTATDNRSSDTSIVQVAAGSEPAMFTQHFRGWDAELFERNTFVDPFEAKMAALKARQANEKRPDSPGTITMDSVRDVSPIRSASRPASPAAAAKPAAPAPVAAVDKSATSKLIVAETLATTAPSSPSRGAAGYVPYDQLKGLGKTLDGVDTHAKENSLSPDEFKQVFGMSAPEFAKLPKWKQVAAKKKADLF